tara:strand:+ start:339 stop:617 length:279 start_codon:yes stop_codon:yes gene_type:complete
VGVERVAHHADRDPDAPVDVEQLDEDVADAAAQVLVEGEGDRQLVALDEVVARVVVARRALRVEEHVEQPPRARREPLADGHGLQERRWDEM